MKSKEFVTEILGEPAAADISEIARIFAKDFLDKAAKAESRRKEQSHEKES